MTDKNDHSDQSIRGVCWTVSKVMAANSGKHIEAVISEDLVPVLIAIAKTEEDETAQQARWALVTASSNATDQQILYLVQSGVIQAVFSFLEMIRSQNTMSIEALESVVKILKIGKKHILNEDVCRKMVHGFARKTKVVPVAVLNLCASYIHEPGFADLVQECGGLQYLKEELASNDGRIHKVVADILSDHF